MKRRRQRDNRARCEKSMRDVTVNGKALAQVLKELSAPFDESMFKDNPAGFSYLPYEVYLARMDTVVGVLNYDFEISDTNWVTIGEKVHVSTVGKMTIRDDNGSVVAVKSSTGDADVICKRETGEAVKAGNDSKIAAHDAFKGCCRMFGIGDEQLRDKRKGKGGKKPAVAQQSTQPGTQTPASEEVLRVVVCGAFKSLQGKGYKAPAAIKETGEKVSLILWQEGIEAVQKYMPLADFLEKYKNKEFGVVATRNSFEMRNGTKEEQVIMLRPYCGKEQSA